MANTNKATCVYFDGPQASQDRDGEEVPVWYVGTQDDEGEDVGKVYECSSYAAGYELANKMARDKRLELVVEAQQA